ncbi:MAG: hypothetical protein CR972_02075 [Candidatus Moraniibacteriota bacterium]|nr:MAG: hypothetical protein CR972_02075 [Candidatus Moranbacteria bacterium]
MSQKNDVYVFGVSVNNVSYDIILETITQFLKSSTYHHIVTLNPEILLKAYKSFQYKKILNDAALGVVDGIGLYIALWRRGKKLHTRITGVDLMHEVLKRVDDCSGKVFLAAHIDGLSSWTETKNSLEVRYPHIIFSGNDIDPRDVNYNHISVDVILCNFGAPEQEIFLSKMQNTNAKIGIGVGGAFDFVTGVVPRAPRWMRTWGLEWLYRLYKQPRRFKRIYNAVIVFPLKALWNNK